jgi:RNA-binding protein FUS
VHTFLSVMFLSVLQMDRRTGKPKIWMYKDKISGKPKGEATVTYDDANAARSAIDWFDGALCCHHHRLFIP